MKDQKEVNSGMEKETKKKGRLWKFSLWVLIVSLSLYILVILAFFVHALIEKSGVTLPGKALADPDDGVVGQIKIIDIDYHPSLTRPDMRSFK